MGGDAPPRVVRGFARSLHLRVRGLRVAYLLVLAGDSTSDAQLDDVGACPQLFAHRTAEAVGAISFGGGSGRKAVPAGNDDRSTGAEQSWPQQLTVVDRALQLKVDRTRIAHHAQERCTRVQRVQGVSVGADG